MAAWPLQSARVIAALCILLAPILGSSRPVTAQAPAPDLILYNGKIFTSNAAHPYVQALAIRGERILATGDSVKMLALRGPATRTLDLGGRTVIPGLNDAHMHLDISPASVELPLHGRNPTREQVLAAISASVHQTPPGSLLTAAVASAVYFDPQMTRATLDGVAPNNPVMLITFTGHAAFLNSAALRKFAIREDQPDPLGGKFERSSDGKLNGVVREYALFNLERQLADATSDADALQQLQSQLDQAAKFGITTIQDMSSSMPPERAGGLLQKLPATIRVRVIRMPGTTPAGRNVQEGRPAPRTTSSLIAVNGTKWLLDGTPLEGTFASRESRASDLSPPKDGAPASGNSMETIFGNFGMLFSESELTAILRETRHDNDPLMLHVSGYTAASAMLKLLQSNGGSAVWSTRRVRFEHGDGLYPDLIPSAKTLGIVVVQNPTHLAAGSALPGLALTKAQPLRSLLDAGIPVALGSDGPMNPYLNIMLASIHPDRPAEAITREQAVIAYTRGSAYAEFAEKEKGTLEPGMLADLAVLSQDIFTTPPPGLPKTESVLTLVGGKVVYDAKVVHPQ
jgi:hypothetical protein